MQTKNATNEGGYGQRSIPTTAATQHSEPTTTGMERPGR